MSQDGYAAHCVELLSAAGVARARRMFGGHGLYVDERFVAVIIEDGLYLKANAQTRERFEAAGCRQWVYDSGRSPVAMPYWSAPEQAMDSPEAMRPWALLALQAAAAKPATKAPKVTQATQTAKAAKAAKAVKGATSATRATAAKKSTRQAAPKPPRR